ncbi:MAG TPA: hypothetical protein PLD47_15970 [Aggregatilineales bacterium]|nr:hypothetical protein [Anaerolineales bacterium]HRE49226.1 hypothetical protein [Aggregatilineales bacterium]
MTPLNQPLSPALRRLLTAVTVVGGIIGIILSRVFRWDDVTTFIATLLIAAFLILITMIIYSRRSPPSAGKKG